MSEMRKGRYLARFASGQRDVERALALRWRAFRGGIGDAWCDADAYDAICRHVLVEEVRTDRPLAAFRLLPLRDGSEIAQSYSAQFYGLSALSDYRGPMVEMGRFCLDPEVRDPDVLRVAWGAMTAHVDAEGVEMVFGCSSFFGTEADAHLDAFAMLRERHLAPKRWLPKIKAPKVVRFGGRPRACTPDPRRAARGMPPLLRTYLAMGGWVSDHAVIDLDLGTMHVFTGLEVRSVPAPRARALRALART